MSDHDYRSARDDAAELRRALAENPDKLAAALQIIARAKRKDPERQLVERRTE
jgi:hypothetical protein